MKKNKIIKRIFKNPLWLVIELDKRFFHLLSDKAFLRLLYRLKVGKKLDLSNPKTFNEKLQWLKINDHNEKYVAMVDKCDAKLYVADLIGKEYTIPTLGVYNTFDEIDFNALPNQFVIKPTHDSGGLVICKDKKLLDYNLARKKIEKSLKRNYFYYGREWPYKEVKPRIIIEEYKENSGGELIDYKVLCFNGSAKMIFTCTERFSGELKVTFFDLEWNRLPFERHYSPSKTIIPKPKNLKKMIVLSELLSKNIPFVRIDWYEIDDRLYFSECTFYPGGGFEEFTPEIWDKKLGDLINLDAKNEE